eukprot:gnl/MRDRNA2_/MRDRNA2_97592_c0_seq1.p1 gnl/MRDRNA2_/MRDRNA2_97592_c0~~gnl/MRDRNA2_/MRDRNA2_97592_c0_seq1.p1  ORF type:complete len:285 (+),score=58.32 gnl/MRDRNA2_/MRDRNA2_97592_c0_seq1:108-962(+)
MASNSEKRAEAEEKANQRLLDFKKEALAALGKEPELFKHFGDRSDGFFLRFLKFNEIDPDEKPEDCIKMLLNYCRFINLHRSKGLLDNLGAETMRPWMKKHFLQMPSTKDKSGRRMILTFPYDMKNKVPDKERKQLYLYLFMKMLMFEDTMDTGFLLMHDMTDMSMMALTSQMSETQDMIADNTFPWLITKIIFFNSPWWLRGSWHAVSPFIPASVSGQVDILGGLDTPKYAEKLYAVISSDALPAGPPYNGGLTEELDAALEPGLGDFFEPEMHPAEKQTPQQ